MTIMTRGTALALVEPGRTRGSAFAAEDFPRLAPRLETAAVSLFEPSRDGQRLPARQAHAALTPEGEVELTVVYPAPGPGPLKLVAAHLQSLGPGYASALTITQDEPASVLGTAVFTPDAAELIVQVLPATGARAASLEKNSSPARLGFARTFLLGMEHIFGGLDHLLFLAGLLLSCRQARAMLAVVTAFSLAHSITLALATLGVVALPAGIVEPSIAASIVVVAIANLLGADGARVGVVLSFGLGLLHGFGFAGALRELGLAQRGGGMVPALLGFNLGVEAGQLAIVVPVLPLLLWMRRNQKVPRWLLPAASLSVAALGLYWLVQRMFLGPT